MKTFPAQMPQIREGAIKFNLDFTFARPDGMQNISEVDAWRQILHRLGLIGQDPERYEGLAFGNVSLRINRRGFFISGTQTGGKPCLAIEDYCQVLEFDIAHNRIHAKGLVKPSSEALTHAAIYEAKGQALCVIHIHSPEIWRHAHQLDIPTTAATIAYGTPAMGRAVSEAAKDGEGIIAMGGHEDGVLAYAKTAGQASCLLLQALAKAVEAEPRDQFAWRCPDPHP